MNAQELVSSLDFYKMTEDYANILLRINRYKDNGWKLYNLPIKTYNIAISEIEKYLRYLDSQIVLIDQEVAKIENNKKGKWDLLMASKRLELIKSQFITLWNQFQQVVNKDTWLDIMLNEMNDYKIGSRDELIKTIEDTEILKREAFKYKEQQKEIWVELDLDDKAENEMEEDLSFITWQIMFLDVYNKIMDSYIQKNNYITSFENDSNIKYTIKLVTSFNKKYTLSLIPENDVFYKDIKNNEDGLDCIIHNIENIKNIRDLYDKIKNIKNIIDFKDNDNLLEQLDSLTTIDSIDDFWKELDKLFANIISKYQLDKTITSYTNLDSWIQKINLLLKNINNIIQNTSNLTSRNITDLLNTYYTKHSSINYFQDILFWIDYKDIRSIDKAEKVADIIEMLDNTHDIVSNHVAFINTYFNEYVYLENVSEYITENINSISLHLNWTLRNKIVDKKNELINKYQKIINLKLINDIHFDINIVDYDELKDFCIYMWKIKTQLDSEIVSFNNDLRTIKWIQSKISGYNYNWYDSLSSVKSDIIWSNINWLVWFTAWLIVSEFEDSLKTKYTSSKLDYEYQEELKRIAKKKEEEAAARRRTASYSLSSSLSSYGSSSSWSSSSSLWSSFSSTYGWSSSF